MATRTVSTSLLNKVAAKPAPIKPKPASVVSGTPGTFINPNPAVEPYGQGFVNARLPPKAPSLPSRNVGDVPFMSMPPRPQPKPMQPGTPPPPPQMTTPPPRMPGNPGPGETTCGTGTCAGMKTPPTPGGRPPEVTPRLPPLQIKPPPGAAPQPPVPLEQPLDPGYAQQLAALITGGGQSQNMYLNMEGGRPNVFQTDKAFRGRDPSISGLPARDDILELIMQGWQG